jgi:hypothetical protein
VETLESYFARPDTPAATSPVGALVARIVEKNPTLSFDEARAEANALLDKAAGRWKYTLPRVMSAEQKAREKERFRTLAKAA